MADWHSKYTRLNLETLEGGVLKVEFRNPEAVNAIDRETHSQITYVWRDIGEDDERIGLVSLAEEADRVWPVALEIATEQANGARDAIGWTKYSLNNWLRMAGPTFDASTALEFLAFAGPEVREGVASYREKRAPDFVNIKHD